MDWALAIDRNREALLRIVAALFAMAGLAEGANAATLPNSIYRAILRILRPAESATRRLVIILARGLTVTLPPLRTKTAKSAPTSAFVRNGVGTGIWIPPSAGIVAGTANRAGATMAAATAAANTSVPQSVPAFPLIDPLNAFGATGWHGPAKNGVPRICVPGYSDPFPISAPQRVPSLDDTVNAERLCRRMHALKRALDDLPGQAKRLARWQAKQDRDRRLGLGHTPGSGAGTGSNTSTATSRRRHIRLSPFRPGWPPGHRARPIHEVDAILRECHTLARYALAPPRTA